MHRNVRIAGLVAALVLFVVYAAVALQGDDILGMWVTEGGKGRVEITKDGETYTGRLVWLREPDYPAGDQEAGKSKHDRNNPDEALRDRPIVGLAVLQGFKFDGEATWAKGTIYDPENGKTYKCKITMQGEELHVRGYIGVSLIGRTTVWERYVEPEPEPAKS